MSKRTEEMLQRAAQKMDYPPAPLLNFPVQSPANYSWMLRIAAALLLVGFILASLLAIPSVRAAIIEIFKVGGVEIWVGETTSVPNATLSRLLDLAGKTTLEKAQAQVNFPLLVPPEMGLPDDVFVQDWDGQMVIMVWHDDTQVEMALYQFDEGIGIYKEADKAIFTEVKGDFAIWIEKPHILWFRENNIIRQQEIYFIEGRVLVWDENGITYRLESALSMEQAIQVAESLGTFSSQEGSTDN